MVLGGRGSGKITSVLLALVLVTTAFAPLATPTTAQSADEPPDVSVTVERDGADPATIRLHLDFENPETRFWVIDYSESVVAADGFEEDETKQGNRAYRWDGETASPTLTLMTNADAADTGKFKGRDYAATEEWTLAPTPKLSVAWRTGGEWRYHHPLQDDSSDTNVEFAGSGVLGSSFVYVGEYDEYTRDANGQRFRVIVADGADPAEAPPHAVDSLVAASRRFHGEPPDEVTAFVLPDPIRRGGASDPQTNEFWVHEDASTSSPDNLWVHEYVHTRQSFELGERMWWFREASAVYFAAEHTLRAGDVTEAELAKVLGGKRFDGARLAEPNSWASPEVPYYRGALVLWGLDLRIRKATDGDRDLWDVFNRMYDHDGPVSYTDFRTIVAKVAGESMNSWLDEHVTTTARPEFLDSKSGVDLGGDGGSGEEGDGGFQLPAMETENLTSTLVLWGGLGLLGVVFGLTLAQYVSGIVRRFRGEG